MAKDSSLKPYSKAKGKSVSSPRTPSHMSSSPAPPETKPKVNGSNGKIHHHRVPGKDISSTNSSSSSSGPSSSSSSSSSSKLNKEKTVKASAKPDQQFTDLFGPPIQTRPSPDSIPSKAKVKDKVCIISLSLSSLCVCYVCVCMCVCSSFFCFVTCYVLLFFALVIWCIICYTLKLTSFWCLCLTFQQEKSKKQKSFHPEKSHSGERSNSRNSNSSTSNSSSTNLTTSNTCPTATTATSKDNSKDNNSNSNNNTTSSKESKDNSTSSNNNNNSNSSSNSNSLTSGSDKVKKSSSSSSSTSSSLTSFRHSAQLSEDYLQQLYWIQKRINELEDPNILQKLVDIIEHNSSCFNITSSTFDFDLLRLDESTVSKLKEVIQGT